MLLKLHQGLNQVKEPFTFPLFVLVTNVTEDKLEVRTILDFAKKAAFLGALT